MRGKKVRIHAASQIQFMNLYKIWYLLPFWSFLWGNTIVSYPCHWRLLPVQKDWYFEYLFAKSYSLPHIFRFRKWEWLATWEQWEICMVQWRTITFTMFKPKRVKFLQLKTTNTPSRSFIFKIKRSILLTNMHSCLVSSGDICPDTIEWVSKGP